MLPLEDASARVLGRIVPLEEIRGDLDGLVGAALSRPVVSADRIPPFDNSAVDGFAVRSEDLSGTPVTLAVLERVLAGDTPSVPVGPGEATQIMTGAPMPVGADAVAMVEWCEIDGDRVTISRGVGEGDNVRPVGDDIEVGDTVLGSGTTVTPAVVGLLATLGETRPWVVRRPVVGVFSTGDELVAADTDPGPGQIRDSNRATTLGQVRRAGFEARDFGLVPDDAGAIEDALRAAVASCDAVVTSGGVSMGDVDLIRVVLDDMGEMEWMQIAIKPAKPFAFGTVADGEREVPVFGLPGNPVSSAVSFELMARPALSKLGGHGRIHPPRLSAPAGSDFRRRIDGKTHFVRVRLDGGSAIPAGGQGSHQLTALATADALAILPDGEGVATGDDVELLLL